MISASISSGAAARHAVRMVISGRSTSGVSWMGRRDRLIAPNRTTSSTATRVAVRLDSARRDQITPKAARVHDPHRLPGTQRSPPPNHDAVTGGDAVDLDELALGDSRSDRDPVGEAVRVHAIDGGAAAAQHQRVAGDGDDGARGGGRYRDPHVLSDRPGLAVEREPQLVEPGPVVADRDDGADLAGGLARIGLQGELAALADERERRDRESRPAPPALRRRQAGPPLGRSRPIRRSAARVRSRSRRTAP